MSIRISTRRSKKNARTSTRRTSGVSDVHDTRRIKDGGGDEGPIMDTRQMDTSMDVRYDEWGGS